MLVPAIHSINLFTFYFLQPPSFVLNTTIHYHDMIAAVFMYRVMLGAGGVKLLLSTV